MNDTPTVISANRLRKTYGAVTAVDDLSFQVARGEIFGIVGPNGADKTTAVECLMGLRQPDGGELRVLGLDPQSQGRELRRRIGMQLQQSSLPEDIKVWEALDLFASFYPRSVDWNALIKAWGLAEKRNSRFESLSGGQKQRLFIALALVNDPELVLLDELTTGLDPQARRNTWDTIDQLRDQGKTVVLVTHFMEEAEKLCDRVAIIDLGKLVALDTPQNLVRSLNAETRLSFSAPQGQNLAWLAGVNGVSRVERDSEKVTVSGSGALLARVATALAERGILPADLQSEQVTLEDVFLALTGRKIRE